jgi:curli production assembly/transport component CsgF
MKKISFSSWCLTWLTFSLLSLGAGAAELRYVPVNPTFGGSPLNATGLQATANAQNETKAPVATPQTALQKFTASIESAIISKLQSTTINSLFDAKGNFNPDTGSSVKAGNFQIQISTDPVNGGLTLVTTDITTGQSTSININALGGLQ